MEQFSSGVRLANESDFGYEPVCIKPEIIEKKTGQKFSITVKSDGTYLEMDEKGNQEELKSAKISLNDCLACSGCVTSAETVLITSQSTDEFLANLKKGKTVVVSLSPQSRASIAGQFNLSLVQAHQRIVALLKRIGVQHVFDTSFSAQLSLLESVREFVERYKGKTDAPLPMLSSSCPGWICYAEKTHHEALPFISTTKSPQQVMGSIVKGHFAKQLSVSGDQIYHACIMPCYDKKLEASREDFYDEILQTRDVDCVLTSSEIVDIARQVGFNFNEGGEEAPIDKLFTNVTDEGELFGMAYTSDGFLEYVFQRAAKELFGVTVDKVEYQPSRTTDMRVATLEVDGKTVLTFAKAYGFKNIQNILRKVKGGKQRLDFVEVMACPSGCLNGGGQTGKTSKTPKEALKVTQAVFEQTKNCPPETSTEAMKLYQEICDSEHSKLRTQYHAREKINHALAIKW